MSCLAFLASCTTDSEEIDEPVLNMGDPKNMSEQGSRCFEIISFEVEGEEQADSFSDIRWEFRNNGTVIARSPNQERPGSWNIGFDNGVQKMTLTSEDSLPPWPIAGIWTVVSLDPVNPQFIDDEGDVLEFGTSTCSLISPELETLNAVLRDSLFVVAGFTYQGEDVTESFNDVTLDFNDNNKVIAQRFAQQRNGQWMTSENEDGLVLTIQFDPPPVPLTYFNAAWDVAVFNDTIIELQDIAGPPGSESYLIITMEH